MKAQQTVGLGKVQQSSGLSVPRYRNLHPSMLPCPPVPRYLQNDPDNSRNLRPHIPQVPPSYPDFQLPSNAPLETDFQMPQDPAGKSGTLVMQSSLQWHSDPERNLDPQMLPGPSQKPSLPRPGPPMMATTSVHSSHQMLSSSLLSSGWEGSSGPMVPSDKFGDQQVLRPELLRKQRKERTVYSSEQRRLLQEHFDQFMYPSLEQRVELALLIGVTEYEIRIWFKNQRARFKQKNSKNVKEVPESTGSSKNVSVSIHSQGHLSILASANVESMSPDTSTASSISKLNPSLEASFCNDQAVEDAGCSSQEDLLDGQGPATSPNPGKPTVIETQTDPEVTDGPVSVEAPVPTTAAARSPYCAQYLHPPSEHLWKWIGEDQDTREDS